MFHRYNNHKICEDAFRKNTHCASINFILLLLACLLLQRADSEMLLAFRLSKIRGRLDRGCV